MLCLTVAGWTTTVLVSTFVRIKESQNLANVHHVVNEGELD